VAVTFIGSARSIVTFGNNSTAQNLFVIQNGLESRVAVNVRRLALQLDNLAVLTAVMPVFRTSRATAIRGGHVMEKSPFNTAQTSDANVTFLAQTQEVAQITATPGDTIWQKYVSRLHTGAEQQLTDDYNMLPLLVEDTGKEFKLRPNESLVVRLVGAAATSNDIGMNNSFVECVFEEDALSTFNISGTVRLSGVPQAGARVVVMEADDLDGTNMFMREVIITPAGGTWASTILTGKVGFVSYQYRSGGTYYNALGSPYLS